MIKMRQEFIAKPISHWWMKMIT